MNARKIIAIPFLSVILLNFAVAQEKSLSKPINNVIDNYISLKNALAAGNGSLAQTSGKELLASLSDVPAKEMDAHQLKTWSAYEARLQYDSRHISEVSLISHQREHFASLSNNLIAVVKALKINRITLYRQYCTADKKAFLSETSGGKDPYMGMEHCSKVTDTFPAAR